MKNLTTVTTGLDQTTYPNVISVALQKTGDEIGMAIVGAIFGCIMGPLLLCVCNACDEGPERPFIPHIPMAQRVAMDEYRERLAAHERIAQYPPLCSTKTVCIVTGVIMAIAFGYAATISDSGRTSSNGIVNSTAGELESHDYNSTIET